MPQSETGEDRRLRALEPAIVTIAEALVQLIADVRKGRKAIAVLTMYDKDNPTASVIGYRLGVVDLTKPSV